MQLKRSIPSRLLVKPLPIARKLFPDAIWRLDEKEKCIYLTFDDGPIPEVTPWVLDTLNEWNAKATFFCIGNNVAAHPSILKRINEEGHSIGNHTYNHFNGWKSKMDGYTQEVLLCQQEIDKHISSYSPKLFRPPYGKLKINQYRKLKSEYIVVMWDVLSMDYDLSVSKEAVLKNVLKHSDCGSVVVFHDSIKAAEKIRFSLPKVLEHFSQLGFEFKAL
jgi:peptidoglycan/xylan/chitin deacetylase (PgdA/CDA1 family)